MDVWGTKESKHWTLTVDGPSGQRSVSGPRVEKSHGKLGRGADSPEVLVAYLVGRTVCARGEKLFCLVSLMSRVRVIRR